MRKKLHSTLAHTITVKSSNSAITAAAIECTGYTDSATITEGVITIPAGSSGNGHTEDSTIAVTLNDLNQSTVTLEYTSGSTYMHSITVGK